MRRSMLNLLLLVAVVLFAAIALYEPGIETPVTPKRLLPLSAEEIGEIAIQNGEQREIVIKRDSDNRWQMVEPLQIAANRYKVESVLDILQQEPTNRFSANEEELARYGLQNPQVELVLRRLSGQQGEQRLLFGTQTPLNTYRYLQLGGEIVTCKDALMPRAHGCAGVVTIKDSAFYPVASLYTNFIDSRLLPEGVEMVSIQLPDFRIRLIEGHWTLESLKEDGVIEREIPADQLAQWIDGWRYASSVDIEPIGDSTAVGQRDEVVITLRSGEELRWTISNQQDGLVLGRADLGIEYYLSDSQRDALLLPPQPEPQQQTQEMSQ